MNSAIFNNMLSRSRNRIRKKCKPLLLLFTVINKTQTLEQSLGMSHRMTPKELISTVMVAHEFGKEMTSL